ncbi:dTDP-4-dehydrorhamnose reductase [Aquipseudomonas alcaligenes]|uniref:dTDP-4-dehydrorhamnose reductase n=1 Tax=Aquipseudomonas alcaligenes TaxID=43263 RepID=UPI003646E386
MRVLVCGARGQVGYELIRLAPEWVEPVGLGSAELDITDPQAVSAAVRDVRPELIINASAYTAVDRAESDVAGAYAVNRDGVGYLAAEAQRLGIPLFHISTDYVFSGDASEPYREDQPTRPTGVYGASKLAGEQVLAATCSRYLILRTSWVFGSHGANFVKTMLRLGREREELAVVADQQGCPTSARSIAQALWHSAALWRRDAVLEWGVYHFAGQPAVSWHEFAVEIFRQARESGLLARIPRVRPITSQEYPTPARRPLWSVLDCSKGRARLGLEPASWQEELRLVLAELPS